jgi:hypothetical protein
VSADRASPSWRCSGCCATASWPRRSSALAPAQLDENLAALDGPAFDAEELERIDVISAGSARCGGRFGRPLRRPVAGCTCAPGKINAFDVGDVQPDGYHDVASVYQAVSAYEDVWRGSRTTSRSR